MMNSFAAADREAAQQNLMSIAGNTGKPALPAIGEGEKMLRTLLSATILAGALAGSAMAQAPDAGCALPSEPEGIPAALDAAITGPADKDRACMKALLIPEARIMFVSLGTDGAPTYRTRLWTIGSPGSKPVATPYWKKSS